MTTTRLLTGKIIGKCYLEALIGEGASAQVYRARHQTLGISVAVKILHSTYTDQIEGGARSYQDRFRREAQITARLSHPGIVRVFDFGEEYGFFYLVMEYVEGSNLQSFLHTEKCVEDRLALRIIAYLATSLSVAHDAGIIHRDIKPCNILLTKNGKLKISDLGLAKDIRHSEYTMANITMGTPAYMAPEAFVAGQAVDHRADIYSLGIILYRMLFGQLPFSGTITQMMSGHLHGKPDYQNRKSPLNSVLCDLLKKMLAKEPSQRFQTCKDLSDAISFILKSDFSSGNYQQEEDAVSSSTINRISSFLENRLGASSTEYQGVRVTHTTTFERVLIWIILVVFIVVGISAYILFR